MKRDGMHIKTVKVGDICVSFDIKNVKMTDSHGKKSERIEAVATFRKVINGVEEEIHRIYNLGNFDYCASLLDAEFAKKEASQMIEDANRSAHSPFK